MAAPNDLNVMSNSLPLIFDPKLTGARAAVNPSN
jgi:hypothetical protein